MAESASHFEVGAKPFSKIDIRIAACRPQSGRGDRKAWLLAHLLIVGTWFMPLHDGWGSRRSKLSANGQSSLIL